ncbi:MAG TPA: hypothetical protein VFC44_01195 [Candidatus Saccharimonadales bacterium]|nr:hypothetical protein [Candidatus Saccharimonadales bacterium]
MKKLFTALALLALLSALDSHLSIAFAQAYTFTTLPDAPGAAVGTLAFGIDGSNIVGAFFASEEETTSVVYHN